MIDSINQSRAGTDGRLEGLVSSTFGGRVAADAVRDLARSMTRVGLIRHDHVEPPVGGLAWFAIVSDGVVVYRRRTGACESRIVDLIDAGTVVGDLDGRFADGIGPLDMTCASARATVYVGYAAEFDEWLSRHPEASWSALSHALMERRRVVDEFSTQIVRPVRGRVASIILRLTSAVGRGHEGALFVEHGLTQGELATLVGATRESVNKALNDFAAHGWITLRTGAFVIKDPAALARVTR